jgi:hypothetical protein
MFPPPPPQRDPSPEKSAITPQPPVAASPPPEPPPEAPAGKLRSYRIYGRSRSSGRPVHSFIVQARRRAEARALAVEKGVRVEAVERIEERPEPRSDSPYPLATGLVALLRIAALAWLLGMWIVAYLVGSAFVPAYFGGQGLSTFSGALFFATLAWGVAVEAMLLVFAEGLNLLLAIENNTRAGPPAPPASDTSESSPKRLRQRQRPT